MLGLICYGYFNFGGIKMKKKEKCTMCGKKFELHDKFSNLHFEKQVGYGSIHDGQTLKFNLCCKCFDRLTDVLNIICNGNIFI